MATIWIRDVPDEDVEALRRCAADAGMSLQAYLRQWAIGLAEHIRADIRGA
ncbi:hypothetical protein ACFYO1_10610 [Nocardia sp. NPDC006044]|uniref:FitA-like ribbon-helix-helix domain-containing protein n=1 Tax=Nocardia sp. NPDC006044 TaxID=3364306 RepID=UPI003675F276